MLDGRWTYATSSTLAQSVGLGLESHCQACHVTTFANQTLQYQGNGTWTSWAGNEGENVQPGTCGWRSGPTSWMSRPNKVLEGR